MSSSTSTPPNSPLGSRRRAAVLAALGALSLGACGGDGADDEASPGGAIETRSGSYRGVGLGDDVAAMRRTFGPRRPAAEGERIVARSVEGENDYSPPVIQLPPLDRVSPPYRAHRYEHVVFLARGRRIDAVIVNADGARLDGGEVRIGGALETARERYGLRCGTAHEDSEYEEFPACTGKIALAMPRGASDPPPAWTAGQTPCRKCDVASATPTAIARSFSIGSSSRDSYVTVQ